MQKLIETIFIKIICFIFGHDYIKINKTRIDDFGNDDGVKVIICSQCGKPLKDSNNIDNWNKCINIKNTNAFNEIKKIGIEKYRAKKINAGNKIWDNF